jgi:hypothetical protein
MSLSSTKELRFPSEALRCITMRGDAHTQIALLRSARRDELTPSTDSVVGHKSAINTPFIAF